MRILLTIETAAEIAGSKQYVHALASAWAEEHEVTVVSLRPYIGDMGNEILKIPGVTLTTGGSLYAAWSMQDGLFPKFDLGIISPACCYLPTYETCKKTLQVTHGIVEAERPVRGADYHVFISEETRDFWNIDGAVIRNPIDTNRYAPAGPPREDLRVVAHFSNYDDILNLQMACEDMGVRLDRIKHKGFDEVIAMLSDADMIFSVGRSAYEAMSIGREVVFCDNRTYYLSPAGSLGDGLASECYYEARANNCSGRWGGHQWSVNNFVEILDAYDRNSAFANRRIIIENHDHHEIAAELLEVAGL